MLLYNTKIFSVLMVTCDIIILTNILCYCFMQEYLKFLWQHVLIVAYLMILLAILTNVSNYYRTEDEERRDVRLFAKKGKNAKKKLNVLHSLHKRLALS